MSPCGQAKRILVSMGVTTSPTPSNLPLTDPKYNNNLDDESCPWGRKTVLTFDGGGIRGYSSLLILRKVMEEIKKIETDPDSYQEVHQSSSDYPWSGEKAPDTNRNNYHEQENGIFRPCHYFDYISGTSTGGLSAIMLGNLRMSVEEALESYEDFGNKVFGKPRHWHFISALFWPRSKYATANVEAAFIELISKKLNKDPRDAMQESFKTPKYQTRSIVFSFVHSESGYGCVYPWRSYDYSTQSTALDVRALDDIRGPDMTAIYKVARATSAAPVFFEPIKLNGGFHIDGAVNANNPSHKAITQVWHKENFRVPAICLSIGTGLRAESQHDEAAQQGRKTDMSATIKGHLKSDKGYRPSRRRTLATYFKVSTGLAHEITEKERTVRQWEELCWEIQQVGQQGGPELRKWWYRLNVDNNLGVAKLDQWAPPNGGGDTLQTIAGITQLYLDKSEVKEQITDIAKVLVAKRRARVKTERWERFAMEVTYICEEHNHHLHFATREKMRDHLESQHKPKKPLTWNGLQAKLNKARQVLKPH